jgi:hypothetical protein
MRLEETIAFYLLIGVGVAVAMLVGSERRSLIDQVFLATCAALFWPMYLPLLLTRPTTNEPSPNLQNIPSDEMAAAIAEVNNELDAALTSLDGWAEDVLESERGRLAELRVALVTHAERIRSIDVLLAGNDAVAVDRALLTADAPRQTLDRRRQSELARRQNIARLAAVRQKSYDDLMATLAWIRELVSMIHLAKFTGAPASRAEELVAQLAAAVEGISAAAAPSSELSAHAGDGPTNSADVVDSVAFSIPTHDLRSSEPWVSSRAAAP